ncbi:MAG: MMPL family transporter [Solirubrobacteraceae bacterium]
MSRTHRPDNFTAAAAWRKLPGMLSPARIGHWSARRPWLAIAAWLGFVVLAVAALAMAGSRQLQNGAVGESARGYALMNQHQLAFAQSPYIYLHSDRLTVDSPVFVSDLHRVAGLARRAVGGGVSVRISRDRHAALVEARSATSLALGGLAQAVPRAAGITTTLSCGGCGSSGNDLARAEALSVPVTLLVLLIAFGAVVAALVPLALAVTAVVAAFGLLGPISRFFPLDGSVKTVVLLIGMAVGVDYALFYVIRSREERGRGLSSHDALERTARTSGRSVVIAGTTVIIAMAAQFAIGSAVFNGIASGTIVVVACAVAGSITVLPALLELLGPRVDRGRIPFLPHLRTEGDSRVWGALVARVLRRPVLAASLSGGLLVVLAIPALALRVSDPGSNALSAAGQSALARQIPAEFPSLSSPAIVVATWPAQATASVRPAVERLETLAGFAHPPFALDVNGNALALALPLSGLGDDAASRAGVTALRDHLVGATLGRIPGVQTAVTGDTAQNLDFTSQMTRGIPLVVGLVLALAFVLLLVTFRSLVVPIKAIVLNLLSVAASYGVLVLVFQHGWAGSILGFRSDGAIISWLPLFLFVVLFGLSMDYHIFILSRVREAVDAGMDTDAALRHAITRTAGVVSSAALVMVGVFSLFATSHSLDLKQAGVGLAVAVALDATVVRGVLLPATMKLLGERNWYLPRRLAWLPSAQAERAEVNVAAATLSD